MTQPLIHRVEGSIQESLAVKQALLQDKSLVHLIATVAIEFLRALQGGHKILLFGNGGSAADAQHIAAEFVGRFQLERPPLPALALTTNTSALTGIGNDYLYENVFARQVEALGYKDDVAVGISTSGRSVNVLKGLAVAKARGLVTVGLTGRDGAMLKEQAQYCICVPAETTPRIQEAHILIGHILSEITETELASSRRGDPCGDLHAGNV
ncbi:MAG: D-sedoheptulose 7-phosphate isomerase [Terriglobia bacterium]|jgi:D-sedoheptulose 7-phosphate isomerase